MSGAGLGPMPVISQISPEFLGLSASQWFWVAVAGWALAVVLGGLLAARALEATPATWSASAAEPVDLDTPELLRAITPDEDAVGGVLRWLLSEVEADGVALLELSPRGETVRIEPRGLDASSVAALAGLARRSLLETGDPGDRISVARWVGAAGTSVLVAQGTTVAGDEEPFRFSRYLLEWVRTSERRARPRGELEDRLRSVPGVAWVEVVDRTARLLATDEAVLPLARIEADRQLEGTGVVAEWIGAAEVEVLGLPRPMATEREPVIALPEATEPASEPFPPEPVGSDEPLVASAIGTQEPRIRLLDVALSENGEATADVRVTWNDREIRGRGHGRATRAGRYFAAAQAVADALRPLLDTDIVIEGLYVATTKEGVDVLISEVRMEGERYVGAVLERKDRPDWTGARAVLDAVNRRLVQFAGRSGRV